MAGSGSFKAMAAVNAQCKGMEGVYNVGKENHDFVSNSTSFHRFKS